MLIQLAIFANVYSPEGLKEVFTTGGIPPLVSNPDPVYERTYGTLYIISNTDKGVYCKQTSKQTIDYEQ